MRTRHDIHPPRASLILATLGHSHSHILLAAAARAAPFALLPVPGNAKALRGARVAAVIFGLIFPANLIARLNASPLE